MADVHTKAMEQLTDFDDLYNSKLLPVMDKLKAECSNADAWGMSGLLSFVAAMVIGFLGLQLHDIPNYGFYFIPLFAFAVISLYKYGQKKDLFTNDYKEAVIKEIINSLCPGAVYKPGECISQHEYKISCLYRRYYDYFEGSDLIEGTVDSVQFRCSDLWTQYDDVKGQPTIFKGLFFATKINDGFTGGTYVWAREAEQLPASIMDEEYRLMPMPHIYDVPFTDKSFRNCFRVCSTYSTEAHAILTPELQQKLVAVREASGSYASFSFVAGHCYMAIPYGGDLLEPSDYDPGDKEEIRKYYLTIQLILGIIKELQLRQLV
jgi:hypothetical protein